MREISQSEMVILIAAKRGFVRPKTERAR